MLQANPRAGRPGASPPASEPDTDVRPVSRSKETALLFAQLADACQERREEILEQVVLLNAGLALSVSRRYHRRGIEGEDLDQSAYLALVMAARSFDPALGHDFVSFAVPSIIGGVKRHFRDQGWTIRVPRRVQEVQLLIDREDLTEADDNRYGEQTLLRLADQLHVSVRDVEEALRARGCFRPASLDDAATNLRARVITSPTSLGEDAHNSAELRALLRPLLRELAPRDRRLLELRFGEDLTQRSIAAELHLTQAQVSRLLSRIIGRLRSGLETGGHLPDLPGVVVSSTHALCE